MTKILKQTTSGGISFLELLLDETLCSGSILVEKELAIAAGGINPYLNAKQKYELLLRIAANGNLIFLPEEKDPALPYLTLEDDVSNENGWQTDCYLVGKYSAELQQNNLFDIVLQSLLDEADHEGRKEQTLSFLEQMISHNDSYWKIAEGDCPILIYKGDDICHNVLNVFAEQFGTALADAGRNVIYFDCGKEDLGRLTSYMYQHFQAIIGIQSYLFSVKMKDEVHYLHLFPSDPSMIFSLGKTTTGELDMTVFQATEGSDIKQVASYGLRQHDSSALADHTKILVQKTEKGFYLGFATYNAEGLQYPLLHYTADESVTQVLRSTSKGRADYWCRGLFIDGSFYVFRNSNRDLQMEKYEHPQMEAYADKAKVWSNY